MIPLTFFNTLITHLFGGSAGREGVAVQLGVFPSEFFSRLLTLSPGEKKILLIAGAGAGFGAAMNTPLAGAVFGLEVLRQKGVRLRYLPQVLTASFSAYFISKLLNVPHPSYPTLQLEGLLAAKEFFIFLAATIFFGLFARSFIALHRVMIEAYQRLRISLFYRPIIGGFLLAILFYLEGSYQYIGLGIETIEKSFIEPSAWTLPLLKLFFTALTLASGFKGGEFTPIVFMGATLGSFIGFQFGVDIELLAALGFCAVFAAASKTPLACALMAAEIFGYKVIGYSLVSCYLATYCAGSASIYQNQIR